MIVHASTRNSGKALHEMVICEIDRMHSVTRHQTQPRKDLYENRSSNLANTIAERQDTSRTSMILSTNSFGSPFNVNWLHLARPGSRPANRIRRTSSPGPGSLGTNTFFSKPAKRTSVAVSKHTSSTLVKSEEERIVLVSDNSAENPGSSRWAWKF